MDYRPNPDFVPSIRQQVAEGVLRASITLQNELKVTLSKSPSPSVPGQPPGVDTGTLRRSVQIDVGGIIRGENRLSAKVGTQLDYGRFLEYGTRFMAARPWLRVTFRKFLDKLPTFFKGIE